MSYLPSPGGNLPGPVSFPGSAFVTGTYSVQPADVIVTCVAATADYTITLPDASLIPNRFLVVMRTDTSAHMVTLAAFAGQFIQGAASQSLAGSGFPHYTLVNFHSTGWQIIG